MAIRNKLLTGLSKKNFDCKKKSLLNYFLASRASEIDKTIDIQVKKKQN